MSATEQAVENLLNEDDWTGKIFSDGWVDAPETIEIIEPATGESLGVAGVANAASVAAATKSAAKAQRAWAATPLGERIAIVRRAGEILDRHRDEIVGWLVRETGSVPPKADVEVTASIGQFEMAASITEDQLEQVLESAVPGRASTARRQPLGVVGVITPVELPARARDALARAGIRARQHRRAQGRPQHARHGQRARSPASSRRQGCPRACCTSSAAAPRSGRHSSRTRACG